MSRRSDLVAFAALTLIFSYMLSIGATFNGILQPEMHITALGILGLSGGVWLILHRVRGWQWHQSIWDVVFLGWGIVFAIATLANLDQLRRMSIGFWYVGVYVAVWYLLTDLLANRVIRPETLLDALLMSGVIILIFGYVQLIVALRQPGTTLMSVPRLVSTLGNPNALGAVLVVMIPVAIARAFAVRQRIPRVILLIYGGLALLLLALSGSRGAYLGAFASLVTLVALFAIHLGILARWSTLAGRWRAMIIGSGIGFVLLSLVMGIFLIRSLNAPGRSADLRTFIYEGALQTFAAQPLTGSGLFTFGLELMTRESSPPVQIHAHAHNAVLHIMAELGLPGLLILLVTLALALWMARRNWQVTQVHTRLGLIAGVSAVVGFGVHHLLDLPAMMPAVALSGLIVWIVTVTPAAPIPMQARWRVLGHPVGISILLLALLITGFWSSQIYTDYVRILKEAAGSQNYIAAAQQMNRVVEADPGLALYSYEQAFLYGMGAVAGDPSATASGIAAYEHFLRLEPANVVALTNLSALYWQAGQIQFAVETLDRAMAGAPESWQLVMLRRRYAEALGDTAIVRAMTERISTLNPDVLLLPEIGQLPDESIEVSVPARFSLRLVAGELEAAALSWRDFADPDPIRGSVLSALLKLAEGEGSAAEMLLNEVSSLARTPPAHSWVQILDAQIALRNGDNTAARNALVMARTNLQGHPFDADWALGVNYAYAQFLRLMIERQFIPQVNYVDDDPVLLFWIDQLERALT